MALLQVWRDWAYSQDERTKEGKQFWKDYFELEKGIYQKLLTKPVKAVKGTVTELAKKYEIEPLIMAGFLDGINDSLVKPNPIDTMEKDTLVNIDINLEKLYYNMVACKADWLYNLPEWDELLSEEKRAELYKSQKSSGTVVNTERKIGRNEPCPCGSGKKYKNCCGRAS
ncbi:MAG: SEC-C domain-containing protein [Lachnospiraceae bacterium]|nr:SEC-C domain-containing protein [Lachnospiraceae bacterium]